MNKILSLGVFAALTLAACTPATTSSIPLATPEETGTRAVKGLLPDVAIDQPTRVTEAPSPVVTTTAPAAPSGGTKPATTTTTTTPRVSPARDLFPPLVGQRWSMVVTGLPIWEIRFISQDKNGDLSGNAVQNRKVSQAFAFVLEDGTMRFQVAYRSGGSYLCDFRNETLSVDGTRVGNGKAYSKPTNGNLTSLNLGCAVRRIR
jgi:hypothetical protein